MVETNSEFARRLVKLYRDDLEELLEAPAVEGYAAEDEIQEAVGHLDAAITDLERAQE